MDPRLTRATWRKSSRSGQNGGQCVEAAPGRQVSVRDSKNPTGGQLRVSQAAWQRFTKRVR